MAEGLLIPAFLPGEHGGWLLDGARLLEGGEPTWPVNGIVEVDPISGAGDDRGALLRTQAVATEDDSALTIGATLAPALRARAGVTVVG